MKNTRHIMARIESHFDSMTDLEKRIANYFLNPSSIYDDLSSQKLRKLFTSPRRHLLALQKNVDLKVTESLIFNIFINCKIM